MKELRVREGAMTADTLATFARCRAMALAAMISAGGRPCWVACRPASAAHGERPEPHGLTTEEREKLACFSARGLETIERLLAAVSRRPAPGDAQ